MLVDCNNSHAYQALKISGYTISIYISLISRPFVWIWIEFGGRMQTTMKLSWHGCWKPSTTYRPFDLALHSSARTKPNRTKRNGNWIKFNWNCRSPQNTPLANLIETYLNRVLEAAAPVQMTTPFCCTWFAVIHSRCACLSAIARVDFKTMRQICRNKVERRRRRRCWWTVIRLYSVLVLLSRWESVLVLFFCRLVCRSFCVWLCVCAAASLFSGIV